MVVLEERNCTLCGPAVQKKVKYAPTFEPSMLKGEYFSARRAAENIHFQLVECTDCGIIFSSPTLNPEQLNEFYSESQVAYDGIQDHIYESYRPILERAFEGVAKKNRFIEIGGGSGFMLKLAAQHGFQEQIEIDPSQEAEAKFQPRGPGARFIRGSFSSSLFSAESVSTAAFFQVLDHVPNPRRFLESIFETLEPGGTAVCVQHDTSALGVRLLGERCSIFHICHNYLFNRRNLPVLFRKIGYTDVKAFAVANNYPIDYWLELLPFPSPLKNTLRSLLRLFGISNLKVKLYAGNFGVIARKPV